MESSPEVYELESIEQVKAIADPLRLRILEALEREPLTATQIGERLGQAAAKVHYHVRELERVGLVRLAFTREKGGILEKYYRSRAQIFQVPHALLHSAPAEESSAALSEFLRHTAHNFMRAFAQALHEGPEMEGLTLASREVWLTDEENREVQRRLQEIVKPYEERRDLPGVRQRTMVLIAHPTELGDMAAGAATTEQQAVGPQDGPSQPQPGRARSFSAGVQAITRSSLERIAARGQLLDLYHLGMLSFAEDVPPELVDHVIGKLRHRGMLSASPAVREVLKRKER